MIEGFYAVTVTAVYHVQAKGNLRSTATKIAGKGKSKYALGSDLGQNKHLMIGIGQWLQPYTPQKNNVGNSYERDYCLMSMK